MYLPNLLSVLFCFIEYIINISFYLYFNYLDVRCHACGSNFVIEIKEAPKPATTKDPSTPTHVPTTSISSSAALTLSSAIASTSSTIVNASQMFLDKLKNDVTKEKDHNTNQKVSTSTPPIKKSASQSSLGKFRFQS